MQTLLETFRAEGTRVTIQLALTDGERIGVITGVSATAVVLQGKSFRHVINPAYIVEVHETPDTVGSKVYSAAHRTIPGRNR